MKSINLILALLCFNFLLSQKKETLYLYFDDLKEENIVKEDSLGKVFYITPYIDDIDVSYFRYLISKHSQNEVLLTDIKRKIISKESANKKIKHFFDKKAHDFEKSTGKSGNFLKKPPYDLNSCFDKIFIYRKIDSVKGILYEVDWIYAIE